MVRAAMSHPEEVSSQIPSIAFPAHIAYSSHTESGIVQGRVLTPCVATGNRLW